MKRIRRVGYYLIMLLFPLLASAQDITQHHLLDQQPVIQADSLDDDYYGEGIVQRQVPGEVMKELQDDKKLRYYSKPKKKTDSNSFQWLSDLLNILAYGVQHLYWLLYVAIGVVAIILLLNFLKKRGYNLKFKDTTEVKAAVLSDEELDLATYEQQIQAAIAAGRFRIAVRLLYLQTLRLLADKNIITFSKEKTNATYLRAMTQTQWYKAFAALTLNYEYIWYGEIPVNDEQFKSIHANFSQFMNELGYSR
jgi:hypothetical protein